MMTMEWWHQAGCSLIGTGDVPTMRLAGDRPVWACCGGEMRGHEEADQEALSVFEDPTSVRLPALVQNVEDPAARDAEQAEQAARLDGWVTSAMRIEHPETRSAVLESLSAHIARTGQVP